MSNNNKITSSVTLRGMKPTLNERNKTLNIVIVVSWRGQLGHRILGFHYANMRYIYVGVNLNCIDVYAVLERANNRKLHVFATKHEANTYSDDDVSI